MFTLAISSCLTTSSLPYFMDLTLQSLMQYCSLQHWTLPPPPVTSTTGYCFCFGSISLFFLELFLHWSPVAYWAPTDLGSSSFNVLPFCVFILFMGFLKAIVKRMLHINYKHVSGRKKLHETKYSSTIYFALNSRYSFNVMYDYYERF